MNIASRAGRWSARHWKTATLGWLALVVCAVLVGGAVGTVPLSDAEQAIGESARAQAILDRSGFPDRAGESVLIASRALSAERPAFRREIRDVLDGLEGLDQLESVRSPLSPAHAGQISRDRHSALIEFEMRGDPDTASDRVQPVLDEVARLARAAGPRFTIGEFGDASANLEVNRSVNDGLAQAETLSLPITFIVLLIAFGAFVAAGIPVLLAFSAVLGAGGLAALASHVLHASGATSLRHAVDGDGGGGGLLALLPQA